MKFSTTRKVLFLCILCFMVLAGVSCRGGYTDASDKPPANWAPYSIQDLSFRFPAGWSAISWEAVTDKMQENMNLLGEENTLALYGYFASPVGDRGTIDYLSFAYMEMKGEVTASDMEAIMDELSALSKSMRSLGVDAEIVQKARIRHYGSVDALPLAYQVGYGKAACVIKIGLVPRGNRIYQVAYSNFTTVKDDNTLERLLTSLTFADAAP